MTNLTLLAKITPLYMNILLGYIAAKTLDTSRDTIARIMFYLINPIIIFNGVLHVNLTPSVLSLPILTFCISTAFCLVFFQVGKRIWDDSTKNLLAFSAGTGNVGYFGLPLALLLFNDEGEGEYIVALLGIILYENSLGYYILAKETHTFTDCMKKLARLPSIYAFFGALLLNKLHFQMPEVFADFLQHIKGTYNVLGMMIIGLGLASLAHLKVDLKFISLSFLIKFALWPLTILVLIGLDCALFGVYTPSIHNALMLTAIVPLAVNTVIVASILKAQPEKAAAAVLLSTLFALGYIPFMVNWFFS